MTELLKFDGSLLVLRVSLGRQDTQAARDIIFELQLRGDPAQRNVISLDMLKNPGATPDNPTSTIAATTGPESPTLGRWRASGQELGLPASLEDVLKFRDSPQPLLNMLLAGIDSVVSRFFAEYRTGWISSFSSSVQIPPPVQRPLKALLVRLHRPDDPLWLEFGTPSEYLPLLPWERMLRAVVDQPVLRLPYLVLPPALRHDPLQVVVCVSAPAGSRLSPKTFPPLLRAIAGSLTPSSLVDVFADEQSYGILKLLQLSPNEPGARISIHRPDTAAEARAKADAEQRGAVMRPWTEWIRDRLQGRGVDILHFVAGGVPVPGSPAVALGMTPHEGERAGEKRDPVRLFGTQALHDLAVELGAWSIVCTSPGGALSRLALRLLVDQLAKVHPGTTVLQDLDDDDQSAALGVTYRFLFGATPGPAPRSEAITLYCQPAYAGLAPIDDQQPILRAFRDVAEQTRAVHQGEGPPPRWVASSQRYLEETVSKALDAAPRTELEHAAVRGVEDALKTISRVLQQASSASEPPAPTEPTSGA